MGKKKTAPKRKTRRKRKPRIAWNSHLGTDANIDAPVRIGIIQDGTYSGRIVRYRADKHTVCIALGSGMSTIASGDNEDSAIANAEATIRENLIAPKGHTGAQQVLENPGDFLFATRPKTPQRPILFKQIGTKGLD